MSCFRLPMNVHSWRLADASDDRRLSEVDQIIAAAKAVLPDLRRLDAEMEALWKALPTSAQGVAWHGATELYDTVEICRSRWDLRPTEEVAVRDGLVAAGYADPFAVAD